MISQSDLVALIEAHRLPLSDEKDLQAELARVFDVAGIIYQREVSLSFADIPDFMVFGAPGLTRGIAVEVKIKGQRRAIYRQIERYCAHEDVTGLVLATNVPMGVPDTIHGKPVALARLSRGWL
jgi:hypothetical protein